MYVAVAVVDVLILLVVMLVVVVVVVVVIVTKMLNVLYHHVFAIVGDAIYFSQLLESCSVISRW